MRVTAATVAVSCLAFLAAGAGHRFHADPKQSPPTSAHLARLWAWGASAFQVGRYEEAAGAFQAAARYAQRIGRPDLEAQCLNNVGAAWLAAFQYREAVETYLKARDMAERQGDRKTAATITGNLATVYAQMGDAATARAEAERALELARRVAYPDPQLFLRAATLRASSGEVDAALPLFDQAARLADQRADAATLAQIWRTAGYEQLRAGRLVEAEQLLLEAFRLHRVLRLPEAYLAYRNLALLRAAKGDLATAERWMDAALEQARLSHSRVPLWSLYYERGNLRRRGGREEEALADFRRAADLARRWRLGVVPSEALFVSVDAGLHQLYGALTETAAALAQRKGNPALAREALEAAEENRAASLTARLPVKGRFSPFPPAYGELLRELHSLELKQARAPARLPAGRLAAVRRALVEMEIREGLRLEGAPSFRWERGAPLVARLQRALGDDEAYLAFHLGDPASFRWTVTRRGLRMDVLAPKSEVVRSVRTFTECLEQGESSALEAGRKLYRELFAGLGADVLAKRTWFLGLDADLFFVPYAALPLGQRQGRPEYLIEQRAIQIVPGANVLGPVRTGRWRGGFLGVADPVYNRADTRWPGSHPEVDREHGRWLFSPARAATPALELPRLPGSAREVRACAVAWGQGLVVLDGAKATEQELRLALASRPAILHLATHVIASDARYERVSIALSLGKGGTPELLGPEVVRTLRPAPPLVVLSGCRSGRAQVVPGAGLLGLTRAWLLAGSRTVIASLWPLPDDEGELFVRFYQHLAALARYGSRAPALALRQAQLDMLSQGDWRARPAYWAGYVLTGVP